MRLILPASAVAAAAILAALPARADDCSAVATQVAAGACYQAAYEAADKALNATYHEVSRRLADEPDAKKLLVDAQRAWIAFRDAECRFSTSAVAGGSAYPMVAAICMAEMTTARNAELAGYLDCAEGDLACPVPPAQ